MDWQATEGVLRHLLQFKLVLPVILLAVFWAWESWHAFFGQREGRLLHAARNLALALFNTICLALLFGAATVLVADWTERRQVGLLNMAELSWPVRFLLAVVLLDGWMYVWHRANHTVPFLWRFHRMHHSDRQMDVTTATRFHLGELAAGNGLRLLLIPLLGVGVWHVVVYDMLVVGITQFHHADISLGRFDRWLRLLVVTPDFHKIHHSSQSSETNSNYSTFFSFWDRLARSFRMRRDLAAVEFGLDELSGPQWQTLWGMLRTPLQRAERVSRSGRRAAISRPAQHPRGRQKTGTPHPTGTPKNVPVASEAVPFFHSEPTPEPRSPIPLK